MVLDPAGPFFEGEQTILHTGPVRVAQARLRDWVHTLVIIEGPDAGRRVIVGEEGLAIGRRPSCGLVLAGPAVSGLHCEVRAVDGLDALLVTDLKSNSIDASAACRGWNSWRSRWSPICSTAPAASVAEPWMRLPLTKMPLVDQIIPLADDEPQALATLDA